MLTVFMLSVVILCVAIQCVICVFILSVIMLNVVALIGIYALLADNSSEIRVTSLYQCRGKLFRFKNTIDVVFTSLLHLKFVRFFCK